MSERISYSEHNLSNDEQKKKYELRMKKQRRREVITVLAMLSSVFIVAFLLALLKGGERMVHNFTGGSMAKAKEIYNNTKVALVGMGIISGIIMAVFLIQTIKERKNRTHNRKEKEAFIDYDRLEMAKIRVEKARMEAKKNEFSKKNARDRSIRLSALEQDDNEFFRSHKANKYDVMSEEEYRKYRQEEYERYMSMDWSSDEDEEHLLEMYVEGLTDNEEDSFSKVVKNLLMDHKMLIGTGAVVLLLIVALLFVLL